MRRVRAAPLIVGGVTLQLLGFAWFLLLDSVPHIVLVAVLQLFVGLGFAAAFPSVNIKGLAQTQESEHGLASGIVLSGFQIGGGIVLALVAAVFAATQATGTGHYRPALLLVVGLRVVTAAIATFGWHRELKGIKR